MTHLKGYYSLLQYCPDRGRAEAVNIGVLLFCPSKNFLEVEVSSGNDRVRRLFGKESFDPRRLKIVKTAIKSRLQLEKNLFSTPEDLEKFIRTRSNDIILTPHRPMRVIDPKEDLANLFKDLVGGRAHRQRKQPIFPELDRTLRSDKFKGRVETDVSIEIPILGKVLEVPYSFKNGTVNYLKPYIFQENESHAFNAASRLTIQGDLLRRHLGPQKVGRRLIVLPQYPESLNGLSKTINSIFKDYEIRVVNSNEISTFIDEIDQQAHVIGA
jgi:hypothetical protein